MVSPSSDEELKWDYQGKPDISADADDRHHWKLGCIIFYTGRSCLSKFFLNDMVEYTCNAV